jgi:hypothetical protein
LLHNPQELSMKTAYLILGTALALSAAALAGPGSTALTPDGRGEATQRGHTDEAAETDSKDSSMAQDKQAGQVTTTVRNGDNLASVIQSGDSGPVAKRIEIRPGYTKLEQRSGNSRSVIVQSNDPANLPLDQLPPALREVLRP